MCRQLHLCNYCYDRVLEYLNAYYSMTECVSYDIASSASVIVSMNKPLSSVSCKLNSMSVQFFFYPHAISASLVVLNVEQYEMSDISLSEIALILSSVEGVGDFATQCSDSKLWLWWRFEYDFLLSNPLMCLSSLMDEHLDTGVLNMFIQGGAIERSLEKFISGLEMQRMLSECLKRRLLQCK